MTAGENPHRRPMLAIDVGCCILSHGLAIVTNINSNQHQPGNLLAPSAGCVISQDHPEDTHRGELRARPLSVNLIRIASTRLGHDGTMSFSGSIGRSRIVFKKKNACHSRGYRGYLVSGLRCSHPSTMFAPGAMMFDDI